MIGDLYVREDGDARFLVLLGDLFAGEVDAVIVTPANRISPVGERVRVTAAALADEWTPLEVEGD